MEMETTVMPSWFRTQLQDLLYLFIWLISGDANGDAVAPAAWDAGPAPGNYCCGAFGFGNGEWRRISATCFQQPVPRAMSIDQ